MTQTQKFLSTDMHIAPCAICRENAWCGGMGAAQTAPISREFGKFACVVADKKSFGAMFFDVEHCIKRFDMGLLGMIPPYGIRLLGRIQLLGWTDFRVVSSSPWVFNNDNGSASNCASNCANNCGNNVQNNSDFRRAVFGAAGSFWKKVLLTCRTSARTLLTMTHRHLFLRLLNIRRGWVTWFEYAEMCIPTNTKRRGHLDW